MRRITTLGLVSLLTTAAMATGCDQLGGKKDDKAVVEELVTQRLEAEKSKAAIEQNAQLIKENAELKTKVEELEKKVASLQANNARIAQANTARTATAAKSDERKAEVKTLHDAVTGGSHR